MLVLNYLVVQAGVYIFHFQYELLMGLGENTPVFKPWVRGKNMILKKGGGAKI